jgi:hypothetical protein
VTAPSAGGEARTTAEHDDDSIPEHTRNDTLYRKGRSLVAKGWSRRAVEAALTALNETCCRPPLAHDEMQKLIQQVLTQPDRPDFEWEKANAKERAKPLGMGLGNFLTLAKSLGEPEAYIEGILSSEGGGWIAGEEKLGKSYYALEEALALALQLKVCGRFDVPVRRRVLFLEEEDPKRRASIRLRALLRGHGFDPDDPALLADLDTWFQIDVWSGFRFERKDMVARLQAAIEDFRPAVVYLDVLRKMTSRDLNKADQASALLEVLDAMRRAYGTVFRVLHHFRKTQGPRAGRGSQELSGSYVLGAWAEDSLFFEAVGRKPVVVRIEMQSKDWEPMRPFRLKLYTEGPRHAPTLARLTVEDDRAEDGGIDEMVYKAIASLPTSPARTGNDGVPIAVIVKHLNTSDKTVRRALKRLTPDRVMIVGQMSNLADLYGLKES